MIDFIDDNVQAKYSASPLDANIQDISEYIKILQNIKDSVNDSNSVLALFEIKACKAADGDYNVDHLIEAAFHQNHLTTIKSWNDYFKDLQKKHVLSDKEWKQRQDLEQHRYANYLLYKVQIGQATPNEKEMYNYIRNNPENNLPEKYKVDSSSRLMPEQAEVIKYGRRKKVLCKQNDYPGQYNKPYIKIEHRWANDKDVVNVINNLQKKLDKYIRTL